MDRSSLGGRRFYYYYFWGNRPTCSGELAVRTTGLLLMFLNVFRHVGTQPRDQSLHSTNKRRYFQYAVRSTQSSERMGGGLLGKHGNNRRPVYLPVYC